MEKLIELLNEYEKVIWTDRVWWLAIDDGAFFCTRKSKKGNLIVQHSSEDEAILQIISKKFWFIQRLTDNDRIDYYKVGEIVDKYKWSLREKAYVVSDCVVESMLMILAIQDDTINFLVSILK